MSHSSLIVTIIAIINTLLNVKVTYIKLSNVIIIILQTCGDYNDADYMHGHVRHDILDKYCNIFKV